MKRLPAVLFTFAAIAALTAGSTAAPQGGLTTPADVRRILSALADDSMQGRASGAHSAPRGISAAR